jgi:hypothetical protein
MIPISEKNTFRYEFWNLISRIRKFDVNSIVDVSPVNYPLFCALNRFPERMIQGLMNVVGIRNMIVNLVGNNDVKIVPQQLYEDQSISSKLQVSLVESRLKALDIQYIYPYYKNDPESKCIQLQNLHDDATVNMINSKFFSHNPIDINKL